MKKFALAVYVLSLAFAFGWVIIHPSPDAFSALFAAFGVVATTSIDINTGFLSVGRRRWAKVAIAIIALVVLAVGAYYVGRWAWSAVLTNQGDSQVKHGQLNDAVSTYRKAFNTSPSEAQKTGLRFRLIEAFLLQADYTQAGNELNTVEPTINLHENGPGKAEYLSLKGQLLFNQGQLQQAIPLMIESISNWSGSHELDQAATHLRLADAYLVTGDYPMARASLDQALAIYRSKRSALGEAEASILFGTYFADQMDPLSAITKINEGLTSLQSAGSYPLHIARANLALAFAYLSVNNFSQAQTCLDQAEPIFTSAGMKKELADVANGRGLLAAAKGEYPAALSYYQQAKSLSKQINHPMIGGLAVYNTAAIKHLTGHGPAALDDFETAMGIFQPLGYSEGIAQTLVSKAAINLGLGNYAEIDQNLSDALERFQKMGNQVGIARVYLNQGQLLYQRSQYHASQQKLLDAKNILENYPPSETLTLTYASLGQSAASLPNSIGAPSFYFDQARKTASQLGDPRIGLNIERDRCLSEQHNLVTKVSCLEKVRDQLSQLGDVVNAAYAEYTIANLQMLSYQLDAAEERINRVLPVFIDCEAVRYTGWGVALLGQIAQRHGNIPLARIKYNEAMEIFNANDYERDAAVTELNIGQLDEAEGNFEDAIAKYTEAKLTLERFRDLTNIATALTSIGANFILQGKYAEAVPYFTEAIARGEEINDFFQVAVAHTRRGQAHLEMEEIDAAIEDHTQALEAAVRVEYDAERLKAAIRINRAKAYIAADRPDLAREDLDWARDQYVVPRNDSEIRKRLEEAEALMPK